MATRPRLATFEELLRVARGVFETGAPGEIDDPLWWATAVIDLFGEDKPCGYEDLDVRIGRSGKMVHVPDGWGGNALTPTEARAYATMLLRAADEAEG